MFYNEVMLLIVLYDCGMLVRMTWYTVDASVPTICGDDVDISIVHVGCDDKCIVQREPYEW